MKTLMQWLHGHPLKAVLFTMMFTAIATAAGFREDMFTQFSTCLVLLAGIWYIVALLDTRRDARRSPTSGIMALLLAGLFCYSPARSAEPPPRENVAAIGVGVVIICVGSYCVYKIVKVCQKKFPPKSTNAPPEELSAAGDEYGGAMEYSSIGSCYTPPDINAFPYEDYSANPTTFTLNVSVRSGAIRTSMSVVAADGMTQSWDLFQAEMAEHGLYLAGRPSAPQYELNGVPCDAASVPLEFDPLTNTVTHNTGGELRRVVIQRSPNMQDWYQLLTTDISDGTGFRVVDTTREGQMFYRLSVQ